MKKIMKYFSLLLISAFLLSVFVTDPVSANYNRAKNNTTVSVSKRVVKDGNGKEEDKLNINVNVTFQRGFDKGTALAYVCRKDEGATINSPQDCSDDNKILWGVSYVGSSYTQADLISKAETSKADSNPKTMEFTAETNFTLRDTERDNRYVVFVQTIYCTVRSKTGDTYNGCQYWDNNSDTLITEKFAKKEFVAKDLIKNNISDIENDELDSVVQKISDVVYDTIMPIIWVVLTVFLVVKGTLLGVQIVKAADEPQVRQEKIGSLKWLVIGVGVAALASGAVTFITGFISGALNFN